MPEYELCADEAWTHGCTPPNRYWCFFGGFFGPAADLERLEARLRKTIDTHGYRREVKWQSVSAVSLPVYMDLVDTVFAGLRQLPITYRQAFLDRRFVYQAPFGPSQHQDLDTQFRIYYQFIKHAFGIRYLPETGDLHTVTVRLDHHSSQAHRDELRDFVQYLPQHLGRGDIRLDVSFVKSGRLRRIQLCDLLMGAAGSHGNKKHQLRPGGRRGMAPRPKARHEMARYIYGALRKLDADTRGTRAFNWFESTGVGTDPASRLAQKVRIWKFIPSRYRLDNGWLNRHLDKEGRYQGPRLEGPIVDTAVERLEEGD